MSIAVGTAKKKGKSPVPAEATSDKRNGKPSLRKAAGKAKPVEGQIAVWGAVFRVALNELDCHWANRTHSDEDVAERVESLRDVGQLDPIKIWRSSTDEVVPRYLVVGGWGRVLAARKLGWSELDARLLLGINRQGVQHVATDSDVLGLLAEDNSQRADLSVFEKAEMGRVLISAGYSQEQAARRVGFRAKSSLSNAMRLAKLPERLRERVTADRNDPRYLRQEVARLIADYAEFPEIIEAIELDLGECPEEWDAYPADSLLYCIKQVVCPVDKLGVRLLGFSDLPPGDLSSLRTITIPLDDEGERVEVTVTTDVEAWNAMNQRPSAVFDRIGSSKSDRTAEEGEQLPPEEAKRRAKQLAKEKAELLQRRRARWEYAWRHRFVAYWIAEEMRCVEADTAIERITIWAISEHGKNGRKHLAGLIEAEGWAKNLTRSYSTAANSLDKIPAELSGRLPQVRRDLVRKVFDDCMTGNPDFPHVPRELVWQLCVDLKFDPAAEWGRLYESKQGLTLLDDLWSAHEVAQLLAICRAQDIKPRDEKKSTLVEELTRTPIPCPDWLRGSAS
jgi:ParB/RepB/Spo0J family partition protein